MPNLRDRRLVKPADVFEPWQEGDPHPPMAIRARKSKKKKDKKYRDIKKDKVAEDKNKKKAATDMSGSKKTKPTKIKICFKKKK